MSLNCYAVVSGEMEWQDLCVEYLPGVWDGPTEEYREVVYVWARTKRDAVKAGVRHWLRRCTRPKGYWSVNPCCYPHRQRENGLNPFAGVAAYLAHAEEDR
jgi:hypothetical protein